MVERQAIGWPITRLEVSFFPVYLATNGLPAIATGEESGLVVDELDKPSVNALRVRNPGDKPVLIVEGERFLGGRQNRAVNVTVLVPALADLEIPVSCLEAFAAEAATEPQSATRRSRPLPFAPRRTPALPSPCARSGSYDGDQAAVWREVDDMLSRASVRSDTTAAADMRRAAHRREPSRAAAIEELVARGPLRASAASSVVQGLRVTAMDLFGAPHLLAVHWGALIRSHLLEPPVAKGRPSATQVLKAVRRFASARAHETPGVDWESSTAWLTTDSPDTPYRSTGRSCMRRSSLGLGVRRRPVAEVAIKSDGGALRSPNPPRGPASRLADPARV